MQRLQCCWLTLVGLVDEDLHGCQVSLCCGGGSLEAVQRHKHLQQAKAGDAASIGHQPGACCHRQQACASQLAARAAGRLLAWPAVLQAARGRCHMRPPAAVAAAAPATMHQRQ
jgi:hypothetical protein